MKNTFRVVVTFILASLPLGILAQSGYEIAKAMDEMASPADMNSTMTMTLTNKQGKTRTSTISSIAADDNRMQIIWFLSPPDDKGVAFLKIEHATKDDEMRLWLPAFKKVRRISSKKKADSFMGSDLSYEDMTSRELEEYTYALLGEKTVDGTDCYILESTPKKGVTRTYKRFITYVSKTDLVALQEEAYDMRDQLLKKRVMKYTTQKDYKLPMEIYVENVQKNHSTRLIFENIQVDTGIDQDIFQEKNLKRLPK